MVGPCCRGLKPLVPCRSEDERGGEAGGPMPCGCSSHAPALFLCQGGSAGRISRSLFFRQADLTASLPTHLSFISSTGETGQPLLWPFVGNILGVGGNCPIPPVLYDSASPSFEVRVPVSNTLRICFLSLPCANLHQSFDTFLAIYETLSTIRYLYFTTRNIISSIGPSDLRLLCSAAFRNRQQISENRGRDAIGRKTIIHKRRLV